MTHRHEHVSPLVPEEHELPVEPDEGAAPPLGAPEEPPADDAAPAPQ